MPLPPIPLLFDGYPACTIKRLVDVRRHSHVRSICYLQQNFEPGFESTASEL